MHPPGALLLMVTALLAGFAVPAAAQSPLTEPLVSIKEWTPIPEGGTATLTLTASPAPTAPITVNVDVTDSGDFAAEGQTGSRTVTIGTDGTASFTVTTVNDRVDEPSGYIYVYVKAGNGYRLGSYVLPSWLPRRDCDGYIPARCAGIFVVDNDQPDMLPLASIGTDVQTVTEGDSVVFTITLDLTPKTDVTVYLGISDPVHYLAPGTPGFGSRNYNFGPLEHVVIPAGQNSATYTIKTEDDNEDDDNHPYPEDNRIGVRIGSGSGYMHGNPTTATVKVKDNDEPWSGPLEVSILKSYGGTEGEYVGFMLRADPSPRSYPNFDPYDPYPTATVTLSQQGGYIAKPDKWEKEQRIPPSGLGGSLFLAVDDDIDGPDGTLTLTVKVNSNATPVAPSTMTLDIRDNDPTVVNLALVGSGVLGAGEALTFTVSLGRGLVKGEIIDVPLAISGTGVCAAGYTLSVKSGTGAALSGSGTLTPILRFSGAGAQRATLELSLVPAARRRDTRLRWVPTIQAPRASTAPVWAPTWVAARTPARRTTVSA